MPIGKADELDQSPEFSVLGTIVKRIAERGGIRQHYSPDELSRHRESLWDIW